MAKPKSLSGKPLALNGKPSTCCCGPCELVAKFAWGKQAGYVMEFFDQSTSPNPIQSWYWDFGDGETSTEQNPVHTYPSVDTFYQVCLTVFDGVCSRTTCQWLRYTLACAWCAEDFIPLSAVLTVPDTVLPVTYDSCLQTAGGNSYLLTGNSSTFNSTDGQACCWVGPTVCNLSNGQAVRASASALVFRDEEESTLQFFGFIRPGAACAGCADTPINSTAFGAWKSSPISIPHHGLPYWGIDCNEVFAGDHVLNRCLASNESVWGNDTALLSI